MYYRSRMVSRYHKIRLNRYETIDEHRHIMQQYLGRKLTKDEFVHHKNGDKKDNKIENLELISRSDHAKQHRTHGDLYKLTKEDAAKGTLKLIQLNQSLRLPIKDNKYLCSRCKEYKLSSEFSIKSARWNGLQPFCKQCAKQHHKCRNSLTVKQLACNQ